jgi:hypothetical protein
MTWQDLGFREKLVIAGVTIGMFVIAAWWIAFVASTYQ